MGIPSFYRHLCRRTPTLIGRGVGARPEWLCLDFNCAMYYVLRRMPPVASATSVTVWEADFCKAIADYMGELVVLAKPTVGAYVSCDGVVCAAKRRQQRLRRFKGPWFAATEAAVRAAAGGEAVSAERSSGWNQNALTPGSAFMARLGSVLVDAGKRVANTAGIQVTVSTTEEPGEGEHKLLAAMRRIRPTSCMIYGLDADLILLSMLLSAETGSEVRLLREAQEFETRGSTEGEWRTLNVSALPVALGLRGTTEVADYVAAMSLLGNDFLPRSLTRTVRDDGIPKLIASLKTAVWSHGLRIVDGNGAISRQGLLALLTEWANIESADMLATCQEARKVQHRPAGIGESPADTAVKEWQMQPARWGSILRILDGDTLVHGWESVYRSTWHAGAATNYLEGVAWVWDYYSGRTVDQGWTFDEHLPPMWSDCVTALKAMTGDIVKPPSIRWTTNLPSWLHLLSVLPAESARELLPTAKCGPVETDLWWWPDTWTLYDVGRTQMWECEPVIPVIPEEVLRSWAH
jgi:5'-3' exonuclease